MEKKKKKTCPQPILLTAADRIYDGKTPLHNTVSKAALSGATLYQAHRWAEDLKPPLPPPRGLFGFVYTERIKGKTDGGGGEPTFRTLSYSGIFSSLLDYRLPLK